MIDINCSYESSNNSSDKDELEESVPENIQENNVSH